jgi:signal transduction histidine kinase
MEMKMKKSGYRSIFHVYLIFSLSLLVALLAAVGLFYLMITVRTPDGTLLRSDWPKSFTANFVKQIVFVDNQPRVNPDGMGQLQKKGISLRIIDPAGNEVYGYPQPVQADAHYSSAKLLKLFQTGQAEGSRTTSLLGTVTHKGQDYVYLLHFPVQIAKVTMYVNGERFAGGKTVVVVIVCILLTAALLAGVIYGFRTARIISRLTTSIQEIPARRYLPLEGRGVFKDIYDSLNTLDSEIKASDRLRVQTENMRREWIANITHDLKTPLSPIKGYAELLQENGSDNREQNKRYAGIMLKNVAHIETLLDDLKLTYQLANGTIPLKPQEHNVIRFLKELVIDILNHPEYEHRTIHFQTGEESIPFTFDPAYLTRALQNLIINAFMHGDEQTAITLSVSTTNHQLQVILSDDGKGMTEEEVGMLFQRYYRGTDTEHQPEGTGLGLAIAKSIVELHGGTISVTSIPGVGTNFQLCFPLN